MKKLGAEGLEKLYDRIFFETSLPLGLSWETRPIEYPGRRENLVILETENLEKSPGVFLVCAAIHGDEQKTAFCLERALNPMLQYAKQKNVGVVAVPVRSPLAISSGERYVNRGENGTDDHARFQVRGGWRHSAGYEPFFRWKQASLHKLPAEAAAMQRYCRELKKRRCQIRAGLDLHTDHLVRGGAYAYTLNGDGAYDSVGQEIAALFGRRKSRRIGVGDGGGRALINKNGLVENYFMGDLTSLLHLMFGAYSVALEVSAREPMEKFVEATLIWARHLIDLIAEGE